MRSPHARLARLRRGPLAWALALGLAAGASAQGRDAAPEWGSSALPRDPSSAGVRVLLRFGAGSVTFEPPGEPGTLVHGAAHLASLMEGALRGYRRREGRVRDGDGPRGGTGPLETRVEAPGSTTLGALSSLVREGGYASWQERIALVVRTAEGSTEELPLALVPAGGRPFAPNATLSSVVRALAAAHVSGPRVRITVAR